MGGHNVCLLCNNRANSHSTKKRLCHSLLTHVKGVKGCRWPDLWLASKLVKGHLWFKSNVIHLWRRNLWWSMVLSTVSPSQASKVPLPLLTFDLCQRPDIFDERQSCVEVNVKSTPTALNRLSKIVVQLCLLLMRIKGDQSQIFVKCHISVI